MAPTRRPKAPTTIAEITTLGNAALPLKGVYGLALVVAAASALSPPVPPPVRLAPFGCITSQCQVNKNVRNETYANGARVIRELARAVGAQALVADRVPEGC